MPGRHLRFPQSLDIFPYSQWWPSPLTNERPHNAQKSHRHSARNILSPIPGLDNLDRQRSIPYAWPLVSIESMSLVLNHSKARGTAKLILIGVANHEGDGGAWPSLSTLMRYANVDRRNAQRALTKLVELGELQVLRQKGGNELTQSAFRPNLYRVTVQCPATCDRTSQHRTKRSQIAELEWAEHQHDPMVLPRVTNAAPRGANAAPPVAIAPPEPSLNLIGGKAEKKTQVIRAAIAPPLCTSSGGHYRPEDLSECFWCGQ